MRNSWRHSDRALASPAMSVRSRTTHEASRSNVFCVRHRRNGSMNTPASFNNVDDCAVLNTSGIAASSATSHGTGRHSTGKVRWHGQPLTTGEWSLRPSSTIRSG